MKGVKSNMTSNKANQQTNAIKATCIKKHKDKHGRIIGYTLMDSNNQTVNFYSDALKEHIKTGRIQVDNLKLTIDNKLITIEKQEENTVQDKILNRAIVLGLKIEEIDTIDKKKCYLITKSINDYMLYIPPEVTIISDTEYANNTVQLRRIKGKLVVTGGENLERVDYLFQDTDIIELNLSKFKPKQLLSVRGMFRDCKAHLIDITHLNIYHRADREKMFEGCVGEIKLNLEEYQRQFILFQQDLWEYDFNLQIQVINEEYSEIKSINNENKLVYQDKVKNTDLIKALVRLEISIEYLRDKFNEIVSTIDYLRPAVYLEYKGKWQMYLQTENKKYSKEILIDNTKLLELIKADRVDCVNNTNLVITSLKDQNFKISLYSDKGWIVQPLDVYSMNKFINNTLNELKDTEDRIERSISKDLAYINNIINEHELLERRFNNEIKIDAKEKGVNIDIQIKVITNRAYERVSLYGYNLVENYISISTTFKTDENTVIEYKDTEQIKAFIDKIDLIASNCKKNAIIKLVKEQGKIRISME